jgi:hypothetical protein
MSDDPQPNALLSVNILSSDGDVSISKYLVRRERELVQQTAALRGMLGPKEKELADVRQAMQAIGLTPSPYAEHVEALKPFLDGSQKNPPSHGGAFTAYPTPLSLLTENLTIKEMILRSLDDHFHNGATPSELSSYMLNAYGRTIDRNSISPQLARLRDNGMIEQSPEGFWRIPKSAGKKPIKEMIVQALLNRFHRDVTVKALHEYIREEYGRVIETPNLLRQLHSLRESDILTHNINRDAWSFAPQKREAFMMQSGFEFERVMRQLQDDPDPLRAEELREAKHGLPWEQQGEK